LSNLPIAWRAVENNAREFVGSGKLGALCHLCIKIEVYLGAQDRDLRPADGMPVFSPGISPAGAAKLTVTIGSRTTF
jgi:hypothetical protein